MTPAKISPWTPDLRDYFAGRALAGILAWEDGPHRLNGETYMAATARVAYEYADAMLKARMK